MASVDTQPARRDDCGFTMVEILIAIVLVGVLSAVVVLGVSRLTSKGETAACNASRDAAVAASSSYFAAHRTYPTTIQQMVDGDQLTLADGVTVTSAFAAQGGGWVLTMRPIGPTSKPDFSCS